MADDLPNTVHLFSWRNANELGSIEPSLAASLESGGGDGQRVIHGALRFEGVADPTFPPELRKVTLALVDEFENLQGHIAETTRSSHEAPRAAERTVITDLLASSDRGLALLGRCLAECRLNAGAATTANGNRGDASASAEAELAEVLPDVMSIWSLCSLYLVATHQPVAALAPRTFWWLKQFVLDSPLGPSSGLQPILQAFESTGADAGINNTHMTAAYFWPLLLHLLMLGELESAAHLLHLGAAPLQQQQSQDLAGPVASLVQLLEQRMQLAPFVEATGDGESATQQGAALAQWRRSVVAVVRHPKLADSLLPHHQGANSSSSSHPAVPSPIAALEGVLVGDPNVILGLLRDGALNTGELLDEAANSGDDAYCYRAVKWALVLSAELLYGDLQRAEKHDLSARLDRYAADPTLMSSTSTKEDGGSSSGTDEQRAKLEMLQHIVCRAEAANIAMAVKLLYSMQGPLPKVCVALIADIGTHAGALPLDHVAGQDCAVRERLLLELAELLEPAIPHGWRSSAKLLRHCPRHGRCALGDLLLRVPVASPQTTDAEVEEVLQWCDFGAPFGQPPLTSTRAAVCGARASFLRQGCGRPAAAGLFLAASGDPSSLGALCRSTFAQAASALEGVLSKLDKYLGGRSGSSSGIGGASSGCSNDSSIMMMDEEAETAETNGVEGGGLPVKLEALAKAASEVNAVSIALELAWDQADRDADAAAAAHDDENDDDDEMGGFNGDVWSKQQQKQRSVALGNLRVGRAGFGGGNHLTGAARDLGTLCAYRDLLEKLAPLLAAQGLNQASGTATASGAAEDDEEEQWSSLVEVCQKLDECVLQAPDGCASHFLAVATHLLNRADSGSSSSHSSSSSSSRSGRASTTPFTGAALERLLALLHASQRALTFPAAASSSPFSYARLNVALVKHLAYGFTQPSVAAQQQQSNDFDAAASGRDAAFGGPPHSGNGGGPAAAANSSGSVGPGKGLFIAPRDHGQRTGAAGAGAAADFSRPTAAAAAAGTLGKGWGLLRPQKGELDGGSSNSSGGLGDDVAVFALGADELLEMPPLY